MSMMPTPLPSRCAAMPSTPPIVTTPVPPMPGDDDVVGLVDRRQFWAAADAGTLDALGDALDRS